MKEYKSNEVNKLKLISSVIKVIKNVMTDGNLVSLRFSMFIGVKF